MIGDVLVENGVIKSTRTFRSVVGRQTGSDSKLQAGRFRLRTELPAETALKMLLDPANKVALKVKPIYIRQGKGIPSKMCVS